MSGLNRRSTGYVHAKKVKEASRKILIKITETERPGVLYVTKNCMNSISVTISG
jgi:hypothetical protein